MFYVMENGLNGGSSETFRGGTLISICQNGNMF